MPLAMLTSIQLCLMLMITGGCVVALFLRGRWIRQPEVLACHALIILLGIYLLAVSAGPEANSRFPVPLTPLMAIYAGWALSGMIPKICRNQRA